MLIRRLSRIVNFHSLTILIELLLCPNTVLGNEDTEMNKTDMAPALKSLCDRKENRYLNH